MRSDFLRTPRAASVGFIGLSLLALTAAWAADGDKKSADGAAEAERTVFATEIANQKTPPAVKRLMQDRKYAEAAEAIDKLLADGESRRGALPRTKRQDAASTGDRDWLAYLKGRALHLAGRYDDAVAAYEQLEKEFPESHWLRRAKFGRAVSLARKGDFQAAETIYREQAAWLLSLDRKQEIADIYLEFADAYFKPADEQTPPDYEKALQFYTQALEVGPKPEKRAEVELLAARCYQALGNLQEAANRYARFGKDQFSKDHPKGELDIEARFRLGECQLGQGQHEEARRTWQDLLAAYPDDKSERIAEATFKLSETYHLPSPTSDEELELGAASLQTFLDRYPTHKLAGQAYLRVAASYVSRGRYEDAVKTLEKFLADERYADRDETPNARVLLGRSYQLQKKFNEALAAWRDYLAKHPAHASWSEVQRQIVNTEFLLGYEARQAKRYDEARKLWGEFLAKYPLDPRDPGILYEFGRMLFLQDKFDDAIAEWRRLAAKYPNTNESSQAQFMIAATLEEKLGKLPEALKEFRKVAWGNYAGQAQARVARLTAKSLAIATERVFRTNETPKIKLTSRNVEQVTVRCYTIDMETYFRKMHLASGVEGLDIALIDPDRTFEFEVPKYAEYQQLENEIEIPLGEAAPKSGVMAVTVSSKTLEATTLVVASDLDIVVKSSRDEVFVFAENLRTGEPWPKARLLISNGQQVFAEAETGDDGVFQKSYEELKSAGDVRVFAVAEASVASNVVGLEGLGVSVGLTERGYIYTDRPAYRAGQMVHVRGVVRQVADDRFTIAQGKKYHLEVFDSRNRLLRQDEVTLGEFGSFHARFALPATSMPGGYRIQVRDEDNHSYQGGFAVHEYQLEPVRLSVDVDRKVFYRGEEIEGKIAAKFYYGAPLADREIRYQLAGGRVYTGKTDEHGELAFKLPTREYREAQALPLVVMLPERNLQTSVNFYLATRGFTIGVGTVRPVYVSGETFEASVTTHDAEGKPIAEKLVLHVLEQTTVDGKVGEREVERHELATDEKQGQARLTLRLEQGGKYILRVEGTDLFKNPISGARVVQVSDDNDAVRLRILADKHTFKVGDTASVQLHWREEPALALVTFQGARVLDYKLIELKQGANELKIPLTAVLAPNFELAVAVMTDARPPADAEARARFRRFHEASSPFTVERELRVKLETKRKGGGQGAAQPGDEVEVTVTTTDPQGQLVAAELSLALIEQSLVEMFGSNVAAIQDFFRGQTREPAVRTTSSVTFAYYPATQPINPQLLAEKDRLEVAAEEAERLKAGVAASFADRGIAIDANAMYDQGGPPRGSLVDDSGRVQLGERRVPGLAPVADLVRGAVNPTTWDEVGAGELQTYENRLGLVISQTQDAEEISKAQMVGGMGGGMGGGQFGGRGGARGGKAPAKAKGAAGDLAKKQWQLGLNLTMPDGKRLAEAAARNKLRSELTLGSVVLNDTVDNPYELDLSGLSRSAVDQPFTPQELLTFTQNDRVSNRWFFYFDANGRQNNVRFDKEIDEKQAEQFAEQLNASGAVLLPAVESQETAFWDPAVVTDKDGKATVTITLPEKTTAWKLLAKGVTTETLAGEAEGELTVKKELFGELKLPLAFTDGDEAEIQATVHNDAVDKGSIEVTLKTTIGGKTVEEKKTLDAGKGLHELTFETSLKRPGSAAPKAGDEQAAPDESLSAAFELTVKAGERSDVLRRSVPLEPYGMRVFATAGGTASSDTTVWVEPPADMPLEARTLEVLIGPNVERSLLDILLAPAPLCQWEAVRVGSGLDTTASDLMAAVALQKLVGATRQAGGPQAEALDGRIRASISLLISSQNDDGSWSWTGKGGAGNRYTSSRMVWALSLARGAGYQAPDDAFEKAISYLSSQIAATSDSDYESKAILLQGLSAAGRGDFTLANRLYRNRPALSNAALAHLAHALVEMDRAPMAGEILDVLGKRNLDDAAPKRASQLGSLPWSEAAAEIRALYLLSLEKVSPEAAKNKELVDWLMAHRTGHRWSPDKATGPAALGLCQWYARTRFDQEHYELTIVVNGFEAKKLDVTKETGAETIAIPAKLLLKGKQRIQFQLAGRGRFAFQCVLGGFVPADKLKSTTKDWSVMRHYEPAPRELDGQPIPRGFGVLQGAFTSFRNPLTQLPVGERGRVELEIWRANVPANTPEEQLEYLVVTEPLPSGVTVIEQSVQGGFERFEVSPGAITFYIGSRHYVQPIQFDVYGYLPGEYRAAPTIVRDPYRPSQLDVSAPKPLKVLALGAKSVDEYKLTPQELFEYGKRTFAKGDLQTAGTYLTELVTKWQLQPDIYQESVQMLLDCHLAFGPDAQIVRYFELIKEKWPDVELSFEKIMKVGLAYDKIGEYERSYLVFRSTVEVSFQSESGVAGFLESQGEFVRSVDVMGRLLGEYPPEAYVAAAQYALAQRVYAYAPHAAADQKLREKKITRVDLVQQALAMLDQFLTSYPEDPAADQASFSLANALLELKAYREAIARCELYAERYPKSDYLDSYWYVVGYSHFALGEHEAALEMCRKVAETKRTEPQTGREIESRNKWQAVYILGQVYHSLGKAADAIREYTRVADRFADARQAIDYFTHKAISLPEVTTFEPEEKAELELKFRNVARCDVRVYKIDLMKFSLLKHDLGGITEINLAGIRPYHEVVVELGDGKDYRDRSRKLPLPLKDEGAYLVVCRGDDLYASGLALVTPLVLDVQEEAASGRVRATVKNATKDGYVPDVHVKVIGSRNADFVSGETDLRGVFVADAIQGSSTVIAQAEHNRYAFFRGETQLGPPPQEAPAAEEKAEKPAAAPADAGGERQLLEGLQIGNGAILQQQELNLKNLYQQNRKGVQAKEAY
ncbi:MAG TPA: tetratricopeptide repeat protein [Pirellulales bacterium]|nr:tetratricopeptide repeat protein [Pirellulales bacterium]